MRSGYISAKRKNDAVMHVLQNNPAKIVQILDMNAAAQKLTGYTSSELIQQSVNRILPENTVDLLESYLDFDDAYADLAAVLRRVPNFQIKQKSGRTVPVSFKMFYMDAPQKGQTKYEILMRDVTLIAKIEELKKHIASQVALQGEDVIFDEGIFEENLDLILTHAHNYDIDVCFTVLFLDQYDDMVDNLDDDELNYTLTQVYTIIDSVGRAEDITSYLGDGHFGLALIDCNGAGCQAVMNRLKQKFASTPIKVDDVNYFPATVSAGYTAITSDDEIGSLLDVCGAALTQAREKGGNQAINGRPTATVATQ